MSKHPSKAWLLLIFVGMWFRMGSDQWQPVHEHLHHEMVVLTGGTTTAIEHSRTTWVGGNNEAVWYFGYGGEVLLYGLAALSFRRLGLFGLGAMLKPGWQAFGSTDFAHLGLMADLLHFTIWAGLLLAAFTLTAKRYGDEQPQESPQPSHIPATRRGQV